MEKRWLFREIILLCIFFGIIVSLPVYAQTDDVFDASRNGDVQTLQRLYTENASIVNTKNDSGYSPLMLAAYRGRLEAVRFLVDKVSTVDDESKYGTPLMAAAVQGHTEIAKLLLDYNANVNSKDANGTTALHYAVMFKYHAIVKSLLECYADVEVKDNRGNTPLDYAQLHKDKKLINLILN